MAAACIFRLGSMGNVVSASEWAPMGSPSLYGLTTPLITTSSGAKMGKTARAVAEPGDAERL